jgi:hypothetical protein
MKVVLLIWIVTIISVFSSVSRVHTSGNSFLAFLDHRYPMLAVIPILMLFGYFIKEHNSDKEVDNNEAAIKKSRLNIKRLSLICISLLTSFFMFSSMITSMNSYRFHRIAGENARDGYYAFIENKTEYVYTHWYWTLNPTLDTGSFRWNENNVRLRSLYGISAPDENKSVLVNTALMGGYVQRSIDMGYQETLSINSSVFMFNPIKFEPYFAETWPVVLFGPGEFEYAGFLNEVIQVNSGLFSFIAREGWYDAEQWGDESFRWMAREAYLALPVEDTMISSVEIDVHNNLENQVLSVYIADVFIKDLEIEAGREVYRISLDNIDLEIPETEWLTIRFVCKETFFPYQIDENSIDTRELGIAFTSIVFN